MKPKLRDGLLRTCFGPADIIFASGELANNTLDFNRLQRHSPLYKAVVQSMNGIIEGSDLIPDAIIPVPAGADRLGHDIAQARRFGAAVCITLNKDPITGDITPKPEERSYLNAGSVAIIEDVPNRLTNVRRVLNLPNMLDRQVAVYGVWDRGDPTDRIPLPPGVMLRSLVSEPIPARLPDDSLYWKITAASA